MMRLTLAIVGKTLFDADVEGESQEIGAALTHLMEMFPLTSLPFYGVLEKLPIPPIQEAERSRATLDALIYRMIEQRRASGEDTGDLLSMLLLAQDELGTGSMTDTQVRDEAMTLFLAGHETTANALTWTWYLLSQHPDIATRLHDELDTVLAGQLPTPDDVARLPYTRMVIAEGLRLYPPAWTLARLALNDYEVGGYCIPKDSIVFMSQWVVHHDARFYPDPLRFDPTRWSPAEQAKRPKFAYFPFGGGPRLCIGEQFAWMEGILLLAVIAQRWRLRLVPGHPVAPYPLVTLRPRHGMRMVVEKR
jgi:cytochrome P450